MNRLRELRNEKKFTLDDIEKETGINRGTYNNYESGKTNPKKETWKKLADFFGVSVPYLQGYIKVPYPYSDSEEQQTMKQGLLIKLVTKETILLVDHNQEKNSSANMNEFIEYSFIQGFGIEDYNPFMSFSQRDVKELYINLDNILYVKQVKYELKK